MSIQLETRFATSGDDAGESRTGVLVARAQLGDVDAFRELYREFAPRVYRFCRSRVLHPADAEDLAQQTFVRAIEALPGYEDRGLPFAAWLFKIARNLVVDFERARRDHLDLDDLVRSGTEVGGADELASSDDRDALVRAMAGLTHDQREVLGYRFFADLTARETGRLMDRDEATVRALQARAIVALRRRLVDGAETERRFLAGPLGDPSGVPVAMGAVGTRS
jgi:RNA polymerase sigma-70 factor (ECF subfamily)